MKKLFSLLGSCLLLLGSSQGASLTVSNYNPAGDGNHGIADLAGVRIAGAAGRGVVGRMNGLSEIEVANKATAGDIAGLNAAFQPFGADFALDSLGVAGAFETELNFDTRNSVRPGYGGSPIYFWSYKGTSRTNATEYLLIRLNTLFPVDSETLPPSVLEVAVNPVGVSTILSGSVGPGSHDYGQGSGPLPMYQMISTSTSSNVAPIANNGVLAAFSGVPKNGVLTASDANNDVLTFAKVTDPTKGTVEVQANGNYIYTANVGQLGADSFTFVADDGPETSAPATINITITEPPPNEAPVAIPTEIYGRAGEIIAGVLEGTDGNDDTLIFSVVAQPASGVISSFSNDGRFVYRPNVGFVGTDSFTFKVNDGTVDSATATVQIVIEQDIPSWVWVDGDNLPKQRGIYGTQGEAAPANKPGARTEAASVSSSGGISYHFGGLGYGEGTKTGVLNDLWSYDSASGEWTWISGGKDVNALGSYGNKGEASETNVPPARSGALMWQDNEGVLWVFGGTNATKGLLNDLWKYDLTENEWTWVGGANTANATGTYGSLGQPAALNAPGARVNAVSWKDASGRLFLFGGRGLPATGIKVGLLNDLWAFDIALGQWTWLSGSNGLDAIGVYGALGQPSSSNVPGGRSGAVAWVGNSGNLWLFGGNGRGNGTKLGNLNDLWQFDFISNEWTWISGSQAVNAVGVYGTLGDHAFNTVPGARAGATSWLASDGSLVLFGGQGTGHFNDVWVFDTEESQWTWLKGSSALNGLASYGQLGVPSPSSTPGARRGSSAFTDAEGNLVIFAGTNGANSNNDVWVLNIPEFPVVELQSISSITEDSATVTVKINPNGNSTSAVLKLIKLTGGEDEQEIDLGVIGSGSTPVTVVEELTDLDLGSRYAVIVEAENILGSGQSYVRIFTTLGTAPAIIANFDETESSYQESAGTVAVEVVLTSPATEAFTLPFTVSGTASEGATGDFVTTPASGSVSFFIGQSRATVNVAIRDDLTLDANETVILTLGTPSAVSVTIGDDDVHTLTIQDNDGPPVFVQAPGSQLARLGSKVVFDGTATGTPVLAYQWRKGATNIAKATLPTYTFASVKLTDAGTYGVDVRNSIDTLIANFDLAVVDTSARSIVQAEGTTVSVKVLNQGTGLTFVWLKEGDPIGQTTDTLTIPNATALDSGDYTCVISKDGTAPLTTGIIRVSIFEEVVAPPAFLAGNYVGLVSPDESAGAPLGGRFDVAVTTKGAYTAKLILGTTTLTGKGQLFITGDATAAEGQATVSFVRKGLPNLTVQFVLSGDADEPVTQAMEGRLDDPFNGGSTGIEGYRNPWVAKPKVGSTDLAATSYAGSYTFGLDIPADLVGMLDIPQGNGFGAATVTTAGTVAFVGRTADGGKFTFSSIVGPEGDVPFYSAFTLTQGYLMGFTGITPAGTNFDSNSFDGSLSWKKVAADAKSKELAYRAGFDEIELTLFGGKWQPPVSGGVIADLNDVDNNAVLFLKEGGSAQAGIEPFTFSIRNLKDTGVVQTVVINKTLAVNPNSVTFKLIANPVGHYSGTFTVPNPVKTLVRTATYQGTFVRLTNGEFDSAGFFLLAQPPEPGQTVKTAPQLCGEAQVGVPR